MPRLRRRPYSVGMKGRAVEFVVDASQTALVSEAMRGTAGDALMRLTVAPVDGTPRYRITALIAPPLVASVMRAVMKRLDETG
jgi:hypothetical protein